MNISFSVKKNASSSAIGGSSWRLRTTVLLLCSGCDPAPDVSQAGKPARMLLSRADFPLPMQAGLGRNAGTDAALMEGSASFQKTEERTTLSARRLEGRSQCRRRGSAPHELPRRMFSQAGKRSASVEPAVQDMRADAGKVAFRRAWGRSGNMSRLKLPVQRSTCRREPGKQRACFPAWETHSIPGQQGLACWSMGANAHRPDQSGRPWGSDSAVLTWRFPCLGNRPWSFGAVLDLKPLAADRTVSQPGKTGHPSAQPARTRAPGAIVGGAALSASIANPAAAL